MKLDGGATFSRTGDRRVALWRKWDHGPRALFIGLNPSTAGRLGKEDQTTRKLRGFCERWGYGGYLLENLHDWCATHPKDLREAQHAFSRDNLSRITAAARDYQIIVCMWGRHGNFALQAAVFIKMMRGAPALWRKLRAFRINIDGSPAHPLMLPYTTALVTYNPEES